MAQEKEHVVSSSHSGGSDRSRNVKQKKIPQRGLGVAQLEKIRVEEQRKKEALEAANALSNNAIGSVTDATSVSPSRVSFRSPNTVYRSSSPSIPVQMNGGGMEDTTSWCRLWNGDYNHRNAGAAFRPPPVNLLSESNAVLPMPRFFPLQQPASPVVNVNPSSPSAVLASSHMEPPSNQNMHCNSYASSLSWPEECKMVGVKRSYPFSLESPPACSFTAHFDPSKSRCDDAAQIEPRNIYISYSRDGPLNPPEQNPRDRDGGRLNGDFLTLAPPAAALLPSDSNHTYSRDNSGSQGPEENDVRRVDHLGASRSREEPFSFFPVRSDMDENNANGEKGEPIDLNLKL